VIRVIVKAVLPIAVIVGSVVVASAIVRNAPKAEPRTPDRLRPPVKVVVAKTSEVRLDVEVHGTVHPRTEISIVPRVSGTAEFVASSLRAGGFFRKGDVLLRVEELDYRLAETQAEARVAQAQARLDREEAEADIARREWEKYGEGDPSPLAVREPQLAEARAMLASAKARLAEATLARERTEIVAPFDGRVVRETVDERQYVTAGISVATVHATDHVEVRLAVPADGLETLDLPLTDQALEPDASEEEKVGRREGPRVTLRSRFGGRAREWPGRLVRTEAELHPRSRTVYARVRVEDPYARNPKNAGRAPLLVGMFVRATLPGRKVDDAFVLPVTAVREDDRVLVVDAEERIRFRSVTVIRREGQEVVVRGGLVAGERVCVTPLVAAVEGMRVHVVEEPES
jgi:RND family efflux transporter MFP subunit